ncbi:hypothetical protein [Motiliproteus sediminis]|uniref:hypothetical protein n=1 Tax=Motiliproteus sediminis TaxID=1468178 RepID=UPI001AEF82C3|nr:hypothetical protein [Motiliproteus sediminis]
MIEQLLALLVAENTKLAVTVISSAVGVFLTIAKIKSMLPRPRLYLKEDIEIMNSLDKSQEEHQIVAAYINRKIRSIYLKQDDEPKPLIAGRTSSVIIGMLMMVSGIYLTYAVHESANWGAGWYIGTLYLSIVGVGVMAAKGLVNRRRPDSE